MRGKIESVSAFTVLRVYGSAFKHNAPQHKQQPCTTSSSFCTIYIALYHIRASDLVILQKKIVTQLKIANEHTPLPTEYWHVRLILKSAHGANLPPRRAWAAETGLLSEKKFNKKTQISRIFVFAGQTLRLLKSKEMWSYILVETALVYIQSDTSQN